MSGGEILQYSSKSSQISIRKEPISHGTHLLFAITTSSGTYSDDLHRKQLCAMLWVSRAVSETEMKRGPSTRGLTSSLDTTAPDLLASQRLYMLGLLAADTTNIAWIPRVLVICVGL